MYLYLSAADSLQFHTENYAWDFTVDLAQCLDTRGSWECGLAEIEYDRGASAGGDLYVYSDICSGSLVSDTSLPILRIVKKSTILRRPYYVDVARDFVQRVRVYIRDKDGKIPSVVSKQLRCTLHLRRKRYDGH